MKKEPKPKVAYLATSEDEARIVFAHSANQIYKTEEYETVTRYPEYDEYASLGYVPTEVLLKAGWIFECEKCRARIDSDYWDYEEEKEIQPVFSKAQIFCCQRCHDLSIGQLRKERKA